MEQQNEILAAVQALGTRMDAGFARVDERFAKVDQQFAKVDEQFAKVDEQFAKVDEQFAKVDKQFAKVDERFAKVDEKFASVDKQLADIRAELGQVKDDARHAHILIEGLRGEMQTIGEGVTSANDKLDGSPDASLRTRVSALEVRVTRLEKKKGR